MRAECSKVVTASDSSLTFIDCKQCNDESHISSIDAVSSYYKVVDQLLNVEETI